jgi:hypothetical protein
VYNDNRIYLTTCIVISGRSNPLRDTYGILRVKAWDSVGARDIKQITEMFFRNHYSDGTNNFKAQV